MKFDSNYEKMSGMTLSAIKALGTVWHVELFEEVKDEAALQADCESWLKLFESRYSRFLSDSWISTLNQRGYFTDPDPQFIELLSLSLNYYEETRGVFNIAIGEKMSQTGYDSTYSFTPLILKRWYLRSLIFFRWVRKK